MDDVEALKPPGSGMRRPVGAEPTSCRLDQGVLFLPSTAFCPGGYFMEKI